MTALDPDGQLAVSRWTYNELLEVWLRDRRILESQRIALEEALADVNELLELLSGYATDPTEHT